MQQKELPVFDIFEEHIKDLPTGRFSSNLDSRFKDIYLEQKRELRDKGKIKDCEIACSERCLKPRKLDDQTEMSKTEESYDPVL